MISINILKRETSLQLPTYDHPTRNLTKTKIFKENEQTTNTVVVCLRQAGHDG
jgi:hypothetical protein